MPLPCGITQTSNDYRLLFVFLEVTCVAWSSKEEQSNALYLNALNNRFCEKTRKVRAFIVLAHSTPHLTFLARMLLTRVEAICMNTVTDRPSPKDTKLYLRRICNAGSCGAASKRCICSLSS